MKRNSWILFLKKMGGKGYSQEQLKRKYYQSLKSKEKSSLKRKKISSPKKGKYSFGRKKSSSKTKSFCRKKLISKIKINMDEYKSGRYTSRAQAVAVSYSQVKKKYPGCKRYFKRG